MKLAVFTKNLTNPAYTGARHGADRAAALHGAETLHFVPEDPDNIEQQIALIDQAIAARPDAVVLSPVHPTAVDSGIRRIHEAGIPIVGLVTRVRAVPCVSFVGSDDYALGKAIAGHLFRKLGGKGNVLVMSGHVDSLTSQDRLRGFDDAARAFPDIRLVDTIAGDYILPTALTRMTDWLADHPNVKLDACLVANDIMAIGVIQALATANRKALVVGVNAIPEAIPALQRGELFATADFNAMKMAYLAAEVAVRHLKGLPVEPEIQLPVQIVDAGSCTQWDRPYEERDVLTYDDYLRLVGA